MYHTLCLIFALFPVGASVVAQEKIVQKLGGKDRLSVLEKKFQGNWSGGPCVGQLKILADGNYERSNYSPIGINSAGTWSIQWDALPPTLILKCRTSDLQDEVMLEARYKLIRLDKDSFAIQRVATKQSDNPPKPLTYSRDTDMDE